MTLNAGDIKRLNRRNIFALLINYGRTTKTDLAARSGLSIPTVYNIISVMEQHGLIERVEESQAQMTPGRPRQYLQLYGNSRYAIGVRYEGEILSVGIVNLCGSVRAMRIRRISTCVGDLFAHVLPYWIEEILTETHVEKNRIVGVGIGLAPDMEPQQEWVECFEKRMGLRALIGRDVHFAVAGEYVNQMQRVQNMLFVSMGTTVNCGLMLDGHVRMGSAGQLGRIGSMVLEGGKTLDELIGRKALRDRFGIPPEYDRVGARAYAARYLAMALHNLLLGCDVQTIVLGGDIPARLGEGVTEAVRDELSKLSSVPVRVQRQSCPTPAVLGAAFGVFHMTLDEIIGMEE